MEEDVTVRGTVGSPDKEFWQGRRVLVTGHTGFKGAWLSCWLRELRAEVLGVSLVVPPTAPSLWDQIGRRDVSDLRADVRTQDWVSPVVDFSPEFVVHLAAQPLVSVGYDNPSLTFESNVVGTLRLMNLLPQFPDLLGAIVVTTDKVYDPRQSGPHTEDHFLGGRDPYSASKAAAELIVHSWPARGPVVTARAGNVIGGGDWAENRLLPDLIRAWRAGVPVELRRPGAVRPWQHVLEPLRGYLLYLEHLAAGETVARALNFGPTDVQRVSVEEVVDSAAEQWVVMGEKVPRPVWLEASSPQFVETKELSLDSTLAAEQLGWFGVLDWREALSLTLEWYHGLETGRAAADLISEQLTKYVDTVHGATS